ncbi:hypothetical protein QS306_13280 [Paraburkholderia bonniea]|uniref:hypothetical protein n=1 Tax=Paraburkholderia bonniea TaxID=2152891 RepID=UPI001FE3F1F5|nr:hypothetical protein [Paraburkholderia bonniea]WJF90052.1 hypothetical protein QS306_13280 [Paraburkholderia bonniea]WJF93366.1 hypothetical protein QS308_13290 [Paraburkholderia bonniea]
MAAKPTSKLSLGAIKLICASLVLASVAGCVVAPPAPPPEQDISWQLHPELAAAQASIRRAYDATSRAQSANQNQLGDHAERAKGLLDQASAELKAAAEYANMR